MKKYTVLKLSTTWSIETLTKKVENLLNEKDAEGFEIVSVAFGVNLWWMPTAYITIRK